ncbi:hypothetical protein DE146DRAFT_634441 [Phaeosphaeria sp. MPI-PUGE-AT-0046c]|nr:hypothetical protein DE146DRAFT_634441 [Phaeosphaeria sp. MPI-PUGE-AT-0046c]
MNANHYKDINSPGRARGHSLQSILKGAGHHEVGGGHGNGGHPGIPIDRLRKGTAEDVTKVTEDLSRSDYGGPESRVSALTLALQGMSTNSGSATESIAINPAVAVPVSGHVSDMRKVTEANNNAALEAIEANDGLRNWCSGLPPKKSFLNPDGGHAVKFPLSRRSTVAEKPELDALLAATKVKYDGHEYLPLTVRTLHRLSPFYKGEKPIADLKLFQCVMITPEINGVHADHVVAAIERIGVHCEHLLVVAPIQTSELGNVFNREAGDITPGNDWDQILQRFPNVMHLAFFHPLSEPVQLSRGTYCALHRAVANRHVTQKLKTFKYDGPVQLVADCIHMLHAHSAI